ncbi:DUF1800 domain-containing protein [Thalassotalea castellviae]|uniref:DUF1800 domain-containing protein n=1 Tax=Thalassotalea castellviae TaxID=3075612 RepID=A0ABU3A5N9_9GAMM|nr:DUF1800 domain-containing protein [Thalassotalea sp. W431]MDT0604423.1 DUF1800 domain-containing protein [Thalassotalea sp. W431]
MVRSSIFLFSIVLLVACGGDSANNTMTTPPVADNPPTTTNPPTPEPVEPYQQKIQAARLLNQATFGATIKDIEYLIARGDEAWLDEQLSLTPSLHYPLVEPFIENEDFWRTYRISAWWQNTLYGEDQLRQRVAFALSEIFVVSEYNGVLFDSPQALANYYDILVKNAFSSYRHLLEEITLSPAMGVYLSMLGNEKPDIERNIRPDENYAREVMQLFSVGLVELNIDGSEKLDNSGQPIPTYDQVVIKGFAHVFTGWNFNGTTESTWYRWWQNFNLIDPMDAVTSFHDTEAKSLFSGVLLPANQTPEKGLSDALDALANHSNVPPFIAKQLIQKLITSNPTPAYVARIASVFIDNGYGERGDLAAVVKAILLDEEARSGHETAEQTFGKVREPIIRATHMWRAFNLTYLSDRIDFSWPDYFFGQAPLASPSVFNFYRPDYSPIELNSSYGLVAPELQIATESTMTNTINFFAWYGLWRHFSGDIENTDISEEDELYLDFTPEVTLAEQEGAQALLEHLNIVLTAGALNEQAITLLVNVFEENDQQDIESKIANIVFLIMSAPQYAIQR